MNDPVLRQSEVLRLVGVNRETLWRWRRVGLFPEGIRINRRGDLGWKRSEIETWLTRRDTGELEL